MVRIRLVGALATDFPSFALRLCCDEPGRGASNQWTSDRLDADKYTLLFNGVGCMLRIIGPCDRGSTWRPIVDEGDVYADVHQSL